MVPGWANRTPLLLGLIFVMQLAFIASYVGALHEPAPQGVPLGVVAPGDAVTQLQSRVSAQTDAVDLVALDSADQARAEVADGTLPGAVIVGGTGPSTDTLVVTQVPSVAYENLYREVLDDIDASLRTSGPDAARGYAVEKVNAFAEGDPQGLTAFYLAIGWVVGGYLLLAFLGFTQRHAEGWEGIGRRLLVLAGYAVASGVGGAVIVGPVLGIFEGSFLALAALGTALSFAVTVVVQALELLAGPIYGTGLAIIAFVIVGNPAAGGPFPRSFLPAFWEAVGAWLPPGMGVDGIRAVVYDTPGMGAVIGRLALYIGVGLTGCLLLTAVAERRHRRTEGPIGAVASDPAVATADSASPTVR